MENFKVWFDQEISEEFETKINDYSSLGDYQNTIKLFKLIENRYEIAAPLEKHSLFIRYLLAKEEVKRSFVYALLPVENKIELNTITGDLASFVYPENQNCYRNENEFFDDFRMDVKKTYFDILKDLIFKD